MILALFVILVLLSGSGVTINSGISPHPAQRYTVSNLDPTLHSKFVNQIYDPNFIPGFQVGLENLSVSWKAGNGRGDLGYWVGPWNHTKHGIPHLAVGPQCCNFKEIPRTQQFRRVDWGDYYYVRAGFASPGVNVENYTTNFTSPAYVGLRTDWDWSVRISLNWSDPNLLNTKNQWAAIGIAATQFVPSATNKLVYSVVNFWMDQNSSSKIQPLTDGKIGGAAIGSNVAVYHPVQLSGLGNRTITVNLSPYLRDTLDLLRLSGGSDPPVISYVYINVEGYNFRWNTTLYSFYLMSDTGSTQASILVNQQLPFMVSLIAAVAVVILTVHSLTLRERSRAIS
jgi:hypothetical protein